MGERYEYSDGTWIVGECLEEMAALPDASVDLILADLPYGTTQNKWDSVLPLDLLWAAYWRIAKPGAAVVLTASQPFTSLLVTSAIKEFRHDWTWAKNKASGHLNCNRQPLRAHEDVLVFGKTGVAYRPQMTEGHAPANAVPRNGSSRNYGAQTAPRAYGGSTKRYPRSVLEIPIQNNDDPDKWHSTQKPVGLFEYLIRTYTDEGMLVLDNTAGSGTTAIAARRSGRRWICIEQDDEFSIRANLRIGAEPVLTRPSISDTTALTD